jgi:hypothetical protein
LPGGLANLPIGCLDLAPLACVSQLDRRTFVKTVAVASGVTAASLYAADYLGVLSASEEFLFGKPSMDPSRRIPHLLRRAGFGASRTELAYYESLGLSSSIDRLLNYEGVPDALATSLPTISMVYPPPKGSGGDNATLQWWWLDRMVRTQRPLEEKMTLFWHNHFATGVSKVGSPYLMYRQNQTLRTHALGNFSDLLMAVTTDPAMLIWLDGNRNRVGSPNENYAREVMEVFSTGRGPYTEQDVKEGARAFTGYTLDSAGDSVFRPALHDTRVKTFLGRTANLGAQDVVDMLVAHPATARNLATELFRFFAYDRPTSSVIDRLAKTFTDSGFNIKALVEAILRSNEFMSSDAYLGRVKSPVEYVATALRSSGATVVPATALASMARQGQTLFNPPTVFGWPAGLGWLNTSTLLERYNFPLSLKTSADDPTSALNPSEVYSPGVSDALAVSSVSSALFSEGLPSEVEHVIEGSTAALSDGKMKVKNIVRLTMASPFYNLN